MPPIITTAIRATTGLDQLVFLIVSLALLAPLGCFIFAILFFLVSFLLGLVNRAAVVFCWAVNGHHFQGLRLGCIDELMLCARWNNNNV